MDLSDDPRQRTTAVHTLTKSATSFSTRSLDCLILCSDSVSLSKRRRSTVFKGVIDVCFPLARRFSSLDLHANHALASFDTRFQLSFSCHEQGRICTQKTKPCRPHIDVYRWRLPFPLGRSVFDNSSSLPWNVPLSYLRRW